MREDFRGKIISPPPPAAGARFNNPVCALHKLSQAPTNNTTLFEKDYFIKNGKNILILQGLKYKTISITIVAYHSSKN